MFSSPKTYTCNVEVQWTSSTKQNMRSGKGAKTIVTFAITHFTRPPFKFLGTYSVSPNPLAILLFE